MQYLSAGNDTERSRRWAPANGTYRASNIVKTEDQSVKLHWLDLDLCKINIVWGRDLSIVHWMLEYFSTGFQNLLYGIYSF